VTTPIHDRFLADYDEIESRLGQLLAAFAKGDGRLVPRLWAECRGRLIAHLETVEGHLIPALVRARERDAWVLVEEHRHIRARLTEIGVAVDSHRLRPDSVRDLADELHAHAVGEDRLLYQWADSHLDELARTSALDALHRGLYPPDASAG
jgi:hemerythrin HHE cation binding domain-containing protein